ncbi:MAG: hypothetical protein NXI04_16515 [Planctomycetaceae bacterium]|nr:hypothetical protein [Planctomycetaceae bacterium]
MNTPTDTTSRVAQLTNRLTEGASPQDIVQALQQTLKDEKDFHRLFDALLIEYRLNHDLPITQPTSLDNLPADSEVDFRKAYMDAARQVGTLFLEDGGLSDAWAYFRTIGEPEPVRAAIEKIRIPREPDEKFDEIMNLALYEGAHVAKGLEFLLKTHGTCNTVTAFGQLQQQMTVEERRTCAAMMVNNIYADLQANIRRDVEARMPVLSADASVSELIKGRDWLFAEGNYHIDVSHLHSTVGFARALEADDPELPLAVELCEYGSMLSGPLQYPGDLPFDDFYKGHLWFLNALAGKDVDGGLAYFMKRLQDEPDEPDRQLIAYVLLDLAQRVGRLEQSLKEAAPLVSRMEDPNGFSFAKLCVDTGLTDELAAAAADNDDVLSYAIARLAGSTDADAATDAPAE